MKKSKLFSEIEWEIFKSLWKKDKISVKEVWQEIYPNGEKAYTTIQTYMDRMVIKGFLQKEKIGLVNFYSPLISEKKALQQATNTFVQRAFNGSFGLLAQFLVDSSNLSIEDIDKIKKLIAKRERSQNGLNDNMAK
jgi:predicted transcriptional regulator